MNEKKYKVVVVILLVVVALLSAYIICDSLGISFSINSNKTQSDIPKEEVKPSTPVAYDLKKAEALVAKYYLGDHGSIQGFVDLSNENQKLILTIPNVNKKSEKCEDVYSKLPNVEKYENEYIVKSDQEMFLCLDYTSIINYDDLNNEYQKLFGSNYSIPKQHLKYEWGVRYYYDQINNRFISAEWNGGGTSASINSYVVKSAEIINQQLIIKVGYAYGGADMDIELQNGTVPSTEFDSLDKKEEFLSKYKEQLKVQTFTFELDNGNYVLRNIED